jgi:prepilin-type N-terminal cleavage/methylation domain-containing protein
MSKMKYLVSIKSDYTVTLYVGKNLREVEMLDTMVLDRSLPLNHGEHRINIESMMSKNMVIPVSHDFKKWDKNTDILFGEAIYKIKESRLSMKEQKRNHKEKMKNINNDFAKNESGFSLIELAVCCAIILTLSMIAMPYYTAFADRLEEQKQQQVEIQEQQGQILDAILNGDS